MGQDVEKLQELIDQHDRIVFFGGAGVNALPRAEFGFSKCGWSV